MPDQQEHDPRASAFFVIEFGDVKGAFRECTGIGSESEVVEQSATGPQGQAIRRKVPGRVTWNNVTLRRGITGDMAMWAWRGRVEAGEVGKARRDGSITMFDQNGAAVARWEFVNAWPRRITGTSDDAVDSGTAVEEIELVHEGSRRVSA